MVLHGAVRTWTAMEVLIMDLVSTGPALLLKESWHPSLPMGGLLVSVGSVCRMPWSCIPYPSTGLTGRSLNHCPSPPTCPKSTLGKTTGEPTSGWWNIARGNSLHSLIFDDLMAECAIFACRFVTFIDSLLRVNSFCPHSLNCTHQERSKPM